MLELSRLKIGQFNIVMKTFDLKSCLEDLAGNFKQESRIKGMDLQLDY